ncbi:hypothetical protein LC55x_2204 [Lysobacter capsici]|jgi:hypothetical protein|nr:hypothetical protein LC55x_2204 [Lysobacter capsici]
MYAMSSLCEDGFNKPRSGDAGLSLKAHRPISDKTRDGGHPWDAGTGITVIGLSSLAIATDKRR